MFPNYIRILVIHPLQCLTLEDRVMFIPWLSNLAEIAGIAVH